MKDSSPLKNFRDMKTAISTHVRSCPRRKAEAYLEVYVLHKEKQRLEAERAVLARRQGHIETRAREISHAIEKLVGQAQEPARDGPSPATEESQTPEEGGCEPGGWGRMTVGY